MLINGMMVDDIEKLREMRRVAHKAFCEYNARQSWKKAMRSRPRIWTEYKAGDYVFVFRAPRSRKRKHSSPLEEPSNKATWVGPGIVIYFRRGKSMDLHARRSLESCQGTGQ